LKCGLLHHTLSLEDQVMARPTAKQKKKIWTAAELRKLPPSERSGILQEQAKRAAKYYRHDPELTDFEAFGEEDLYVDSADAEAR
jgi:adenylate kinase